MPSEFKLHKGRTLYRYTRNQHEGLGHKSIQEL